jgi:thiamine transporter ThiT
VKVGLVDNNLKKYEHSKLALNHFYGLFYIQIGAYIMALIITLIEYILPQIRLKFETLIKSKNVLTHRNRGNYTIVHLLFETLKPRIRFSDRFS